MSMRLPNYDRVPIYIDGAGIGWVGYGMFDEWPSASFLIIVFKGEEQIKLEKEKAAKEWDDYERTRKLLS